MQVNSRRYRLMMARNIGKLEIIRYAKTKEITLGFGDVSDDFTIDGTPGIEWVNSKFLSCQYTSEDEL